jgi:DNA-binding CsgD family transcriptional regulator
MKTSWTLERGLGELLRLIGSLVALDTAPGVADHRRRVEYDLEVAIEALRRLVGRLAPAEAATVLPPRPRHVSLTERELTIARLLLANRSYKEIAVELGLTLLSVQSRVKEIYMKLAIHSKLELKTALELLEQPPAPQPPSTTDVA